jgi:hypothetical protein
MPSYKSRVVYITVSRCGFLTCTRLALTFLCDMFILIKRITSCISVEDYEYHKENAFSPPRCLIAIGSAEEKEESLQLAWISKNASCFYITSLGPGHIFPTPSHIFPHSIKSEQQQQLHFGETVEFLQKPLDPTKFLTRDERHKVLFRLPPTEEDVLIPAQANHSCYTSLVERCLKTGAWTLTDDELKIITNVVPLDSQSTAISFADFQNQQSPETQALIERVYCSERLSISEESKAISPCLVEFQHHKEAKRAERQLQRYRSVQQSYLELLQDSIHKEKPSP